MREQDSVDTDETAGYEWRAFLFIAVILFPVLSIMFVGGYGFTVWMLQVFFWGPPGHG
ncbi:trimethylamine N-oxide reductase system protein TorE [Parasalinivibrio latis]|uniref:trimethylamine N-oxide reductase system protein TorE n=1 Tax=Parasalinivibrio latis TaxID=2952610 RepID=UPI0030DF19DC